MTIGPAEDKWIRWVALTTTLMAVMAAIASLKGGAYSTKVNILTTAESGQWGYYQAKSIKQNLAQLQKESFTMEGLGEAAPLKRQYIEKLLGRYDSEIRRYEVEKNQIKEKAESFAREQIILKRHGGRFMMSVMFFQIGIMLSSVAALLKKKVPWVLGLGFGIVAAAYFAGGLDLVR